MNRPLTFAQACARYPHRYTVEHVPAWALTRCDNGKFYAPQFASDLEWYTATRFPGEGGIGKRERYCHSTGQTWPLGKWLTAPTANRSRPMKANPLD